MRGKYSSVALSVFMILAWTQTVTAAPRSSPRSGVLLKKEGYYCTIQTGDRVVFQPAAKAEKSAKNKGYLTAEEFFTGRNSNLDTLEPGKFISFSFSLRSNLGADDVTFTNGHRFPAGTYQVQVSCQAGNPGQFVYIGSFYSLVYSGETKISEYIVDKSGKLSFKITGTCNSGELKMTRLT